MLKYDAFVVDFSKIPEKYKAIIFSILPYGLRDPDRTKILDQYKYINVRKLDSDIKKEGVREIPGLKIIIKKEA